MTETPLAEPAAKTSRFAVGQKIVAMKYVFSRRLTFYNGVYCPWTDELSRIDIVVLTVTSQHDVPSCHGPAGAKCYTGFLLSGPSGEIWANQFPTASYGQVTDEADWTFHRHLDSYDNATDEQLSVFEEAGQALSRIQRGIAHFGAQGPSNDPKKAEQLKAHLDDLTAQIKKETGASVRYVPIWADHPDITRAEFHWD